MIIILIFLNFLFSFAQVTEKHLLDHIKKQITHLPTAYKYVERNLNMELNTPIKVNIAIINYRDKKQVDYIKKLENLHMVLIVNDDVKLNTCQNTFERLCLYLTKAVKESLSLRVVPSVITIDKRVIIKEGVKE